MRIDVLDHHRGVIDEDAHRKREAAQGHDVDGLPGPGEAQDRAQDRERDRSRDDQGRASGAQEQQDDQAGQHGRRHHLLHDILHRRAHEGRGIVRGRDLHAGGQGLQNLGYFCLDTRDHRERRGIPGFEHFQAAPPGARRPVRSWSAAARRSTHGRRRPRSPPRQAYLLDRQCIERIHIHRRSVGLDQEIERPDLLVTRRQHDVLLCQSV